MDRNELIEKAKEFWAERANQPAGQSSTRAEAMADFVLSLETKDEWPQKGDEYWTPATTQSLKWRLKNPEEVGGYLANGIIFRTEAESERYRRQRIARTAIHRWIEENAEKVDWDSRAYKFSPIFNSTHSAWSRYESVHSYVPGWFYVGTIEEYNRMMDENAAYFDVLKEGME